MKNTFWCTKPTDGRYKIKESLISIVERKLEILKKRRPLTQGELERLNEEFLTEYTYNSNAIEGNSLTLRETDLILRGITINQKSLKEHLEVIGHKEAFDYVKELVSKNIEISEKVIKNIHYLVLAHKKEDRGIYRKIPVQIIGSLHKLVQPYLIQEWKNYYINIRIVMKTLLLNLLAFILNLKAFILL